jgi:hypothetical protein
MLGGGVSSASERPERKMQMQSKVRVSLIARHSTDILPTNGMRR